ncbi:MAG: hypothetical protein FD123_1356 [Bacteroidetes bacterium]|nr:MAG: hypothetical protein FD123_1356 [Bacteroidota bacterium]
MSDQPLNLTIPKPCHEDWNKMTPNEQGSFCKSCCKTVVDFTAKTTGEIKSFFENIGSKKVCGRFNSDQLQPVPVRAANTRQRLSRFVYALYLVFGAFLFTSCSSIKGEPEPLVGKIAYVDEDSLKTAQVVDSPSHVLMGDTVLPEPIKGKVKCPVVDTAKPKEKLMGKPAYVPVNIKGEVKKEDPK